MATTTRTPHIREQLNTVRIFRNHADSAIYINNNHFTKYTTNLKPCGQWRKDGADHINISNVGETEIGRTLDIRFHLPFSHEIFGRVNSIGQVWSMIDEIVGGKTIHSREHNTILLLADAVWTRFKQFPSHMEALKKINVHLDMYEFSDFGVPRRGLTAYFWLEIMYACLNAAKADKDYPDFSSLNLGKPVDRDALLDKFVRKHIPNHRSYKFKYEADYDFDKKEEVVPVADEQVIETISSEVTPAPVPKKKKQRVDVHKTFTEALERFIDNSDQEVQETEGKVHLVKSKVELQQEESIRKLQEEREFLMKQLEEIKAEKKKAEEARVMPSDILYTMSNPFIEETGNEAMYSHLEASDKSGDEFTIQPVQEVQPVQQEEKEVFQIDGLVDNQLFPDVVEEKKTEE